MFYDHSIIYAIVLKDPIDEFEVVPDIMKALRCKVAYKKIIPRKGQGPDFTCQTHDVWHFGFKIATDCDSRLLKSKYYNDNKSSWFDNNLHYDVINNELTSDIPLTESEQKLHNKLIEHQLIKDNILHDGWVEIANHY